MLARMWRKKESLYTACGNVNLNSHYRSHYGGFLGKKLKIYIEYITQLYHILVFTKRSPGQLSQRYLQINVYCSIVHHSRVMEST